MDLLTLISNRPMIIALALVGAVIATVGNLFLRRSTRVDPRTAKLITRFG